MDALNRAKESKGDGQPHSCIYMLNSLIYIQMSHEYTSMLKPSEYNDCIFMIR